MPVSMPTTSDARTLTTDQTAADERGPSDGTTTGPRRDTRPGSLTKEAIRRGIHERINEVRQCWERMLVQDRSAGACITVRFVINARGRVASAEKVGPGTGNAALDQCILAAVKAMVFPVPAGGDGKVIVTYPFIIDVAGG